MTELIAALCILVLLASLYGLRRRTGQARRRKWHSRATSPMGRTLSARTEMRAFDSATTVGVTLKKRSRDATAETPHGP